MKQSRTMSLIEAIVSILVGFGISVSAQAFFLPMLGIEISLRQNLTFALIMTVISIARQFVMRRIFEALHIRRPLSAFAQAVVAERVRQKEVEGWSHDHDDQAHGRGDLAIAGACYAISASRHDLINTTTAVPPAIWPWSMDWWKPTMFRRDLVKACALIIAEGEKFDRARKPAKVTIINRTRRGL